MTSQFFILSTLTTVTTLNTLLLTLTKNIVMSGQFQTPVMFLAWLVALHFALVSFEACS